MAVNPQGPVITPDQADRLVRAIWIARALALANHIPALTNTYETQAAAESDDNIDSAIYGDPGTISGTTIILARQMTFPAAFMAVVTTNASGRKSRREGIVMSRPKRRNATKIVAMIGSRAIAPRLRAASVLSVPHRLFLSDSGMQLSNPTGFIAFVEAAAGASGIV